MHSSLLKDKCPDFIPEHDLKEFKGFRDAAIAGVSITYAVYQISKVIETLDPALRETSMPSESQSLT